MSDQFTACPHCSGEIKVDAVFCRHCGSSESDGWKDEYDETDDDFEYDQYVRENFPDDGVSGAFTNFKTKSHWRLVALILLLLFFLGFVCL